MSQVTLKAIEDLMDNMLDKKLDEKLEPVIKTQKQHTAALAQLMTEKKAKDDSKTVTGDRLDNLEEWGQKVGDKVGVKLAL